MVGKCLKLNFQKTSALRNDHRHLILCAMFPGNILIGERLSLPWLDCKVCEGRDHVYIIHDGIPKLWHLAGHVVAFQ